MRYAPGAVIVRFEEGVRPDSLEVTIVREIVRAREEIATQFVPNLYIFRGLEHGGEREVAVLCSRLPGVMYAHRDLIGEPAAIPNDLWFPQQWSLRNTGQVVNVHTGVTGTSGADLCMVPAWNVRTDSSSITVAILDSGVNYLHYDLAANIWTNPDEIPGNGIDDDGNGIADDMHGAGFDGGCAGLDKDDPMDYEGYSSPDPAFPGGHGTAVATFFGAVGNNYTASQPLTAMCGVSWKASIMPIRVMSFGAGGDSCPLTTSAILQAFEYAHRKGAKIVNCSWGFSANEPGLYDAFSFLDAKGMLACVCAHNFNRNIDDLAAPPTLGQYPPRYTFPSMLVVGASDQDDGRSIWAAPPPAPGQLGASNYGAISVDLFAPGSNLRGLDGNYQRQFGLDPAYFGGTSYATPIATSVCALVWAQHPSWTAKQVVDHVKANVEHVNGLNGLCVTGGVINAAKALSTSCEP